MSERISFVLIYWSFLLIAGCGEPLPSSSSAKSDASLTAGRSTTADANSSVTTPKSSIRFSDATAVSGIRFTYQNDQQAGNSSIIESLGGGVAVMDYDLDGHDDVCLAGGGRYGANQAIHGLVTGLFRNGGHWQFDDVAARANLTESRHYSHGVNAADFDSDGFIDFLITGVGGLELWKNQGDGTFQNVTVSTLLTDHLWSSSAGWGDLNGDGALDLFVVHYVDWSFANHPVCAGPAPGDREVCPPRLFTGLPDTVYFSNGDGSFRDASEFCGIRKDGKGLAVLVCDLDLDGDLDVYVANDTVDNFLYENKGDGRFADVSLSSATALNDRGTPDGSMGVDCLDFNLDGRLDLWVTNYENETSALYQNLGQLFFRHVSRAAGISAVGGNYVSWGTCCFDMECDGDEDIFVSNGHVIRFPKGAPLLEPPILFENSRGVRFINIAATGCDYMRSPHMGRGTAVGDFDSDGRLDLVVSHTNENAALLRNESNPANHWIELNLVGVRSPRDAIGTTVRVTTSLGTQIRQWRGGGSYASTNCRCLHFGLGTTDKIDRIEIRWPSGTVQTLTSPTADHKLLVIEPD